MEVTLHDLVRDLDEALKYLEMSGEDEEESDGHCLEFYEVGMQAVEQVRDALRAMALAADRAALDRRSDDDHD